LPVMSCQLPTVAPVSYPGESSAYADGAAGGWIIAESLSQYRPRHPEHSAFYQLFETHFDNYVRVYEERFEPTSGAMRPVVVRAVDEFLDCGRLQGGFARIRCDNSDISREARSTWARLIKKIFETDPLLCTCGGRMRIVSFITDPRVVDRILRHKESGRCKTPDPFEPRPPPGASTKTLQKTPQ
jgi:hypothetical protein